MKHSWTSQLGASDAGCSFQELSDVSFRVTDPRDPRPLHCLSPPDAHGKRWSRPRRAQSRMHTLVTSLNLRPLPLGRGGAWRGYSRGVYPSPQPESSFSVNNVTCGVLMKDTGAPRNWGLSQDDGKTLKTADRKLLPTHLITPT